jgi:hypothetical protein
VEVWDSTWGTGRSTYPNWEGVMYKLRDLVGGF